VLEIFSFYNKQMVKELKSERSSSYDYLQKNGNNSERDEESQGSVSWHNNSQSGIDGASAGRGSMHEATTGNGLPLTEPTVPQKEDEEGSSQ